MTSGPDPDAAVPPVPTPPVETPSHATTPARARYAPPLIVPAVAVLVAVVVLIAVLLTGGSGEVPPATGAARLVPADALAYVNLSIDGKRPAVKRALALAGRLPGYPLLTALIKTRLGGLTAGAAPLDFATDIQPWLGNEAAIALLNTSSSTAGSLIVLAVRDRSRAEAFLNQAGASVAGAYRSVELRRYASGTVLAFLGRFLVLGQDASVRAAIDVNAGAVPSLAANSTYKRAAAGAPAARTVDAYASAAGVRRVLAAQGGIIGAIGALLYQPALSGVTVSLSASATGVRLRVHSALDPQLVRLGGPRPVRFEPSLDRVIPSGSLLMLDVTGLDKLAPRVLNAGAAGGVAGRIGPLLRRLGSALRSEGVNLADVISLFAKDSVVAITPSVAARAGAPAQRPALTIVARTPDEARTRSELAALEVPLQQLFPPPRQGAGQAPVFNDRPVGSLTVHQLVLAPGLEFDYTVANGLVILSTNLNAAAMVARHGRTLVDDPIFNRAFPTSPGRVTSLLFLDFSQLLTLGEQTGLERSRAYRSLRADLFKIRTVGLESTSGETDSTAELFLQIP